MLIEVAAVLLMVSAAVTAIVPWLALVRLSNAYGGFLAAILVASTSWVVIGLPAVPCFSLVKNYPGLWRNPYASRMSKVLTAVGRFGAFVGLGQLFSLGICLGLGWLADLRPCVAFDSGVTGGRTLTDCR